MLLNIIISVYVISIRPFNSTKTNLIEAFNELSILIGSYHMFLFTDFVPDQTIKYLIGWSLILVTLLNILVNFILMTVLSFKEIA